MSYARGNRTASAQTEQQEPVLRLRLHRRGVAAVEERRSTPASVSSAAVACEEDDASRRQRQGPDASASASASGLSPPETTRLTKRSKRGKDTREDGDGYADDGSCSRSKAAAATATASQSQSKKSVRFARDTVDNEHMDRRKSKICCIYHRPRRFDESDSDESDSDAAGSDDGGERDDTRCCDRSSACDGGGSGDDDATTTMSQ